MKQESNLNRNADPKAVATLAGGCFWCLEAVYADLKGVEKVLSGYAGGNVQNTSYQQVCTGKTGHAEVVQITYDPKIISYRELLEVFFTIHDPTTLNRQGADVGTQYRSAIFFRTPEEKATAEQEIHDLTQARVWDRPIVTEFNPLLGIFSCRRLPPKLLCKQPRAALLPDRDCPQSCQVPQALSGSIEGSPGSLSYCPISAINIQPARVV